MKSLIVFGHWSSYTLSVNTLPQWLALAGLLALMVESILWAESEPCGKP